MLVAGLVGIAFVGLVVFLLVSNVELLPKSFLKFFRILSDRWRLH